MALPARTECRISELLTFVSEKVAQSLRISDTWRPWSLCVSRVAEHPGPSFHLAAPFTSARTGSLLRDADVQEERRNAETLPGTTFQQSPDSLFHMIVKM